jgi:1-aminocyclopropane-1-carboxylate deaminase
MVTITNEIEEKWLAFNRPMIQPISFGDDHPACSILRLDQIQSWASGNKYYKLKYPLYDALQKGISTIISKGGMFSNHLAALAEASSVFGKQLVAVIRCHAPDDHNPSIINLQKHGAEIIFMAPRAYDAFDQHEAEKLFPEAMFIPEGGLSKEGIKGASEISNACIQHSPTHVIISGGTMGTACGLLATMPEAVNVIIVPAWKGCSEEYVLGIVEHHKIKTVCSWQLWPDFHFGGFGKFNVELIDFMTSFTTTTGIPLDPVYTGKLMYGLQQKLMQGYFTPSSNILAIHTGGLQGLKGFKYRYPEQWNNYIKVVC